MHKPASTLTRRGLVTATLLLMSVAGAGGVAAAATAPGGATAPRDSLTTFYDQTARYSASDYTADSWAAFTATRNAVATLARQGGATDGLVMVRGLKSLVADYQGRSAAGTPAVRGRRSPRRCAPRRVSRPIRRPPHRRSPPRRRL